MKHGVVNFLSQQPQGVLHNPKNDKRTTEGVFHVVEGGLPVSADKKVVPKIAFQRLLQSALNPPADLLTLPFTSNQESKTKLFVSLLLRPVLSPEVEGFIEEKRHEVGQSLSPSRFKQTWQNYFFIVD
jgi:hypothetical protein